MGVAGSGKTTVGRKVAAVLGWPYFEADDFHPATNIAKMSQGQPLNDSDRAPWLTSIRAKMNECRAAGQSAVFTCSALKERYRSLLGVGAAHVRLVHLTGDMPTLLARLAQRQGHYMKPEMLQSQLDALEPPAAALTIDVKLPPEEIVQQIVLQVRAGQRS